MIVQFEPFRLKKRPQTKNYLFKRAHKVNTSFLSQYYASNAGETNWLPIRLTSLMVYWQPACKSYANTQTTSVMTPVGRLTFIPDMTSNIFLDPSPRKTSTTVTVLPSIFLQYTRTQSWSASAMIASIATISDNNPPPVMERKDPVE